MSAEANKKIIRRYYEEVYNQQKDAVLHDLFASDFGDTEPEHHPYTGPALAHHVVLYERSVFPDIQFTIHHMVAEADDVVVFFTVSGTHQGDFRGIPPTGKAVSMKGVECWRLHEGKIVQQIWSQFDLRTMFEQIGMSMTL